MVEELTKESKAKQAALEEARKTLEGYNAEVARFKQEVQQKKKLKKRKATEGAEVFLTPETPRGHARAPRLRPPNGPTVATPTSCRHST